MHAHRLSPLRSRLSNSTPPLIDEQTKCPGATVFLFVLIIVFWLSGVFGLSDVLGASGKAVASSRPPHRQASMLKLLLQILLLTKVIACHDTQRPRFIFFYLFMPAFILYDRRYFDPFLGES